MPTYTWAGGKVEKWGSPVQESFIPPEEHQAAAEAVAEESHHF